MSDPIVLDPASGARMFYFDKADDRVLFGDIRRETHILCDGRALEVNPDEVMDFRALPFADGAFRVVVFDPPHLVRVGRKSWMFKKYGGLLSTWREDLAAGFAECFRVLADDGVLIFKWNEDQIPVVSGSRADTAPPAGGSPHRTHGKDALDHLPQGGEVTDHIHAVPRGTLPTRKQCHWCWQWENVLLRCEDDAIPGKPHLCAAHYIASVQAKD